jgi:hypothetical protein
MIVISYRRADTGMIVGRIFEQLEKHFGKDSVFMDIENIPGGMDFREHITTILQRCDILVALIGPNWNKADDNGQPRIQNRGDWVRIEIETALAKRIPIIPILIDRTPPPKPEELPESLRPLAYIQAMEVAAGRDFRVHMQRVLRAMDRLLGRRSWPLRKMMAIAAAFALVIGGTLYYFRDRLTEIPEDDAIRACNTDLTLPCIKSGGVFGAADARSRAKACTTAQIMSSDHPSLQWIDVWTTSIYSFAPGGGGPGGGLDNDELRVGGWGDWYFTLVQFKLPPLPSRPKFAAIMLYAKDSEGASVPLALDRIIQAWKFPKGDRLWWKDRPGHRAVSTDFLPAPKKQQWYIIELTEVVHDWLDQKFPNYGIQVRPVHDFGSFVFFVSSDAADMSKTPRLLFCF